MWTVSPKDNKDNALGLAFSWICAVTLSSMQALTLVAERISEFSLWKEAHSLPVTIAEELQKLHPVLINILCLLWSRSKHLPTGRNCSALALRLSRSKHPLRAEKEASFGITRQWNKLNRQDMRYGKLGAPMLAVAQLGSPANHSDH